MISGLLVAGILGAAMGSLSSALNSMSNSTVADIIHNLFRSAPSEEFLLALARLMTLVWAVLMALFACAFSTSTGNVYLTGLTIAGYTYGALLGAFLLGRTVRRANETDAVIAFLATVGVMTYIVRGVRIDVGVAGNTVPTAIAAAVARSHRCGDHAGGGRCGQPCHRAPESAQAPADGAGSGPDRAPTAVAPE
ncbi:hypothetical protein GCM10017687_19770 [Streptomyces echinatus]|uniref:sodium:solute symporter family transporter n=1 Tax=Streptomyces echinatus TaxID=67293 RepID=UPI0031EDA34D